MGREFPSAAALGRAMEKAHYKISEQTVRDYINKKALPTADKLFWLSEFFGKSMDWFFDKSRDSVVPPALAIEKVPWLKTYGSFSGSSENPSCHAAKSKAAFF